MPTPARPAPSSSPLPFLLLIAAVGAFTVALSLQAPRDPSAVAPRPTPEAIATGSALAPTAPARPGPTVPDTAPGSPTEATPVELPPPDTVVVPPPPARTHVEEILRQIDALVRAFKLEEAEAALAALASEALDPDLGTRVIERRTAVGAYLGLVDKLAAAAAPGGRLHDRPLDWPGMSRTLWLVKVDRRGLRARFTVGETKGEVGEAWGALSVARAAGLFALLELSADEALALAALAVELGAPDQAESPLVRAWHLAPARRDEIARRLAAARGEDIPTGGYAAHKGKIVPAADLPQLERGLVRFRGEWVSAADKSHLERGHVKEGGKWIPLTKEQLLAKGYVEHEGRWISARERERLTATDTPAPFERRTAHWLLKVDHGERFADKMAVSLESAYAAFEAHFGQKPTGTAPMVVKGFRRYEDYRAYCQKVGATRHLAAAGFCPSEPRTCCGWDSLGNANELARTLVHEACHLYHLEAVNRAVPSWVAEGMATYFEGYEADGKGALRFHHKPAARMQSLKAILGTSQAIGLAEMATLDAGELIGSDARKAVAFYASCWGWYYFFHHHPHEPWRKGYAKYVAQATRGAVPDLEKLLGTKLEVVQAEFERFIKKQ